MAPMKRQRPALDDGSGEVIEVDNVSSNLQQASVSQGHWTVLSVLY